MELKCFKVLCMDDQFNTYEIGVMTSDIDAAKKCAENSLLEGKHIKTHAFKVHETDRI